MGMRGLTYYDPETVLCACGRRISLDNAWQKVIGWEHRRSQGGTNHVALRRPQNEFMCDECMGRERRGINGGQGDLGL